MGKTIALGFLVGIAGGLASGFILHLLGIELTPAVLGGAVGGSVGAWLRAPFTNLNPLKSSDGTFQPAVAVRLGYARQLNAKPVRPTVR